MFHFKVCATCEPKPLEFSCIQIFFSHAKTIYFKCHGCTTKVKICMVHRNRRRGGENAFPLSENVWECKRSALPQLWVAFPYSVGSFLSKYPLFLKVASQLLRCSVTFSSRKYSESYQMFLGVQHRTTLSLLVIVQLFTHRGILANLSILRTRKYN